VVGAAVRTTTRAILIDPGRAAMLAQASAAIAWFWIAGALSNSNVVRVIKVGMLVRFLDYVLARRYGCLCAQHRRFDLAAGRFGIWIRCQRFKAVGKAVRGRLAVGAAVEPTAMEGSAVEGTMLNFVVATVKKLMTQQPHSPIDSTLTISLLSSCSRIA